jgi:hypothetical protein
MGARQDQQLRSSSKLCVSSRCRLEGTHKNAESLRVISSKHTPSAQVGRYGEEQGRRWQNQAKQQGSVSSVYHIIYQPPAY